MHRVTDGFQEKRESILDALMNIQSSFKSDPKASTRLKENLRKFVHKLGEFKAASERGRYPISRCFSERSERIARAAWDASMAIETGDLEGSEIEQILEMLRLSTGRLSLNPYNGEDVAADEFDQDVDRIHRAWRTMTPAILAIWALLDLPRLGCKCRQCQKRFGR